MNKITLFTAAFTAAIALFVPIAAAILTQAAQIVA